MAWSCCSCGRLFNRLRPHGELVTVRVTALDADDCIIGDIETFAHLCPDCMFSVGPEDDGDSEPVPVLLAA